MMAKVVELSTMLPRPIDQVWDEVTRPRLLLRVAGGFVAFRAVDPPHWPDRWEPREYLVSLRLVGVLPLGRQVIGIEYPTSSPDMRVLRDNGRSQLVRRWDHRITLRAGAAGTVYTDRIEIEAGWLTTLVAGFALVFFRHRQRRLRQLVAQMS